MFIDTHCHLYDEKLKDRTQEIVLSAREAGVEKLLVAGCDIPTCREAIRLAEEYEEVYACVGFYPENANEFGEEQEKELRKMLEHEKVVAVGEIGLDYSYKDVSKQKQKEVLLRQLMIANELKKPVVLHGRDAYGDLVDFLKENKKLIGNGGTFHCYTGSYELAKEIVKLGFFISVGGVSTFQNAVNVKEMLQKADLENLLLETDSPYLAPVPMRGKVNEPKYIPYIAENLAKLKNISVEEIAEKTTKNAKGLFKI